MSGFVPGFDNDIFISYAHTDNPVWLQAFEKSLREELSRRLGTHVSIWQDERRLRVGRSWQAEIETGIRGAAVFIAVLSPSYRNSEWCARERDIFRQLFAGPEEFEKSGRFFKVVKTPWENDGHRSFWPTLANIDFFRREEGPVGAVELSPGSMGFRDAIGRLASSLVRILRRLRLERERVFVASPAEDCRNVWEELRGELKTQGYDVQPEGLRDDGFADGLILSELESALLSIHLLGATYDPFVLRQIQLAADLGLRLMFWLAPGSRADADQARLIAALRNGRRPDRPDVALPPNWSLLEDLTPRRLIQEVLAVLRPRAAVTAQELPRGGSLRVYLLHDTTTEEDARIASSLQDQIQAREGMEVFLPRADLSWNEMLLRTCEGVLLFSAAAPQAWLVQMATEVLLAEKLLKRAPLASRAFLVPDPAAWNEWSKLKVIPYGPAFQPGDLEPFLAPLRAEGSLPKGH